MDSITVRKLVKFKSQHKDEGIFIVRELRYGGKVLIENIKDGAYYIVPVENIVRVA